MIAMFILVIIVMATARAIGASTVSRKSMDESLEGVYTIDTVKKIIICNYTYEEVKEAFKEKEVYLNLEALGGLSLESVDIIKLINHDTSSYPLVKFKGIEGQGGTMKVNIAYYFDSINYIEGVFYKGDYEQIR